MIKKHKPDIAFEPVWECVWKRTRDQELFNQLIKDLVMDPIQRLIPRNSLSQGQIEATRTWWKYDERKKEKLIFLGNFEFF